jgi:hypothetical protein
LFLLLHPEKAVAIVPASLQPVEESERPASVIPVVDGWVRRALLAIALGLLVVFGIAAWLNPYDENGEPRRKETHLQLGLPPCTFSRVTGVPCPSCGMTTSFALLVHGDVLNSLRANAVGTLLAGFCLLIIPWSLACSLWRRSFFILSFERALTWIVIVFVSLLLARWVIVLGLAWWFATPS